jgi:uncharacterized membrane protein
MPRHRCGWLGPALILLVGAAYQWLVYSAVGGGQNDAIRLALAFLPLAALGVWIVARARHKVRWSVALAGAALAIYAIEQQATWGPAAAYSLPHAAAYLSMLWLFAQTLRRGHEPLITRLARRVHGNLTPALHAYTRRLTGAWCVFFAGQLAVSALLFAFGSPREWSLFVNVLNFPLLALMFSGEYVYRIVRHRDFPQASMMDGIRAFTDDSARSRSRETTGLKA